MKTRKHKRTKRQKCTKKQNGGVLVYNSSGIVKRYNARTVGELKGVLKAIKGVYRIDRYPHGERNLRNNIQLNMDNSVSSKFISIETPLELSRRLLSDNYDVRLINVSRVKLASSPTGDQNWTIFKKCWELYGEEQKTQLKALLSESLGTTIDIYNSIVGGFTLYASDYASLLLQFFHDKDLLIEYETIGEVLDSAGSEVNKMNFIHILFGEIFNAPGAPPCVWQINPSYDHAEIDFNTLSPSVREIYLTFIDILPK